MSLCLCVSVSLSVSLTLRASSGLITLAACDFFKRLQGKPELSLMCCFFEIYSGKLYDLLNDRRSLAAREDGKQNVRISDCS